MRRIFELTFSQVQGLLSWLNPMVPPPIPSNPVRDSVFPGEKHLCPTEITRSLNGTAHLKNSYHPHPPPNTPLLPQRESVFPAKDSPCPAVKSTHLNGTRPSFLAKVKGTTSKIVESIERSPQKSR